MKNLIARFIIAAARNSTFCLYVPTKWFIWAVFKVKRHE